MVFTWYLVPGINEVVTRTWQRWWYDVVMALTLHQVSIRNAIKLFEPFPAALYQVVSMGPLTADKKQLLTYTSTLSNMSRPSNLIVTLFFNNLEHRLLYTRYQAHLRRLRPPHGARTVHVYSSLFFME